jgi:Ca2+:H+ antiporter
MSKHTYPALPLWTIAAPVAAALLLVIALTGMQGVVLMLCLVAGLIASIFASVHHAEVIAHRVGEPFGTLVLALAVTIIEVALIVSLMLSGGSRAAVIPRDTVFAAIMIVCNGAIGLCILLGGLRHRELSFRVEGANPALTVLTALAVLTLVLPTFTTSAPGATFTQSQLIFAGLSSIVLYAIFVFIQTVRHRDYFLPSNDADDDAHAVPPSLKVVSWSGLLLLVSLVAVVGLAKMLSPAISAGLARSGAPESAIGIVISMLVLSPESYAAVRAALANRLQTSLNLSLGSALASIGLTIPAVACVSIAFDIPLTLGLDAKDVVLLALTLILSLLTLAMGTTTVLQGVVHLVMLAAYLFLSLVP